MRISPVSSAYRHANVSATNFLGAIYGSSARRTLKLAKKEALSSSVKTTPPSTSSAPPTDHTVTDTPTLLSMEQTLSNLDQSITPDSRPLGIVNYDPESVMGEERAAQAKASYTPTPPTLDPNPLTVAALDPLDPVSAENSWAPRGDIHRRDQFRTLSVIELIVIDHLLHQDWPKGKYRIYYTTKAVDANARKIVSQLSIQNKETPLLTLDLVYDIKELRMQIFNKSVQVGELRYDCIVKTAAVEEITGHYNHHNVLIDPVWESESGLDSHTQHLVCGDYKSTFHKKDTHHWQGPWKKHPYTIPFSTRLHSRQKGPTRFQTKKRIELGDNRFSLTHNYFDDCVSEPYHSYGAILIR